MTARDVQFSIMFFAASEETLGGHKYRLVLEAARFADRHGFSSVWIPERHFAPLGGLYPNPSVLHAALAVLTERIQLRAGSVVLPLHHPVRVAEEWSVVDNLSGGRVGLSFASGWNPDDFAFFPERYAERWEEVFRSLPVVQKLWRGEPLTVTNGLGQAADVRIYPRPVQAHLPTWITAARSPATFARAGEVGANVLTHLLDQDPDEVAGKVAVYRQARARAGHDPDTGVVTMMLHTFVGRDGELVREQGRKPYCDFLKSNAGLLKALAASRQQSLDLDALSPAEKDEFVNLIYDRFAATRSLIGTPESCLELVARLRAVGVDEIACLLDFGPAYDLVLENLPYLDRLRERCTSDAFHDAVAGRARISTARTPAEEGHEGPARPDTLGAIRERCADVISGPEFYQRLRDAGLEVPTALQGIVKVWRREGEALGQIGDGRAPDGDAVGAVLDCCLQVSLAALPGNGSSEDGLFLPWEVPSIALPGKVAGPIFGHAVLGSRLGEGRDEIEAELRILGPNGEAMSVLPKLLLRRPRATPAGADALERLSYELGWEQVMLSAGAAPADGTAWIVLADESGVGRALASLLEARGERTTLLPRPPANTGPGPAPLDPEGVIAEVAREVEQALGALDGPANLVFLWSLDSTPPEAMTDASLRLDQVLGAVCASGLIRHLAARQSAPRLWFVTRGAQRVAEETRALQLAQSPLWGLGRTCAIEHPELWGGLIDLDPDANAGASAAQLLAAFRGQEDQVAFRHDEAWAPRLTRARPPEVRPIQVRPDAAYVVTGGLRGIGYEVARWLVRKGARRLVLLGRGLLPPREEWDRVAAESAEGRDLANIRALERSGAEVLYAALDVADRPAVTALADALREQGRPVRGIIHAASVWRDSTGAALIRPLIRLDAAALEEVFRPKVLGTWILHQAFAGQPLDFFVLFSSAASLTGSAGQGNYAAASGFLDALADYRLQNGQAALSVNWGPVSGAGFGATQEGLKVHEYWEAHGLKRISVEQLLAVLEALLPHSRARLAVMDVDWPALARVFPALGRAAWSGYVVDRSAGRGRPRLVDALAQAPAEERLSLVVDHLRREVADVMGLDHPADPQRKLFEMGMDSLMTVALKNRLEESLGTSVRVTAVFNHPTISALSDYLLKELFPEAPAGGPAPPAELVPAESALTRVKALTEDDVDQLLESRLRKD